MSPREKKIDGLMDLADELLQEYNEILQLVKDIEQMSDEEYRQMVLADTDA